MLERLLHSASIYFREVLYKLKNFDTLAEHSWCLAWTKHLLSMLPMSSNLGYKFRTQRGEWQPHMGIFSGDGNVIFMPESFPSIKGGIKKKESDNGKEHIQGLVKRPWPGLVNYCIFLLLLTTSAWACLQHSHNLANATTVQKWAKRRGYLLS